MNNDADISGNNASIETAGAFIPAGSFDYMVTPYHKKISSVFKLHYSIIWLMISAVLVAVNCQVLTHFNAKLRRKQVKQGGIMKTYFCILSIFCMVALGCTIVPTNPYGRISTIKGNRVFLIPENGRAKQIAVHVKDTAGFKAGDHVEVRDGRLFHVPTPSVAPQVQRKADPIPLPKTPDIATPRQQAPVQQNDGRAKLQEQRTINPVPLPKTPDMATPRQQAPVQQNEGRAKLQEQRTIDPIPLPGRQEIIN